MAIKHPLPRPISNNIAKDIAYHGDQVNIIAPTTRVSVPAINHLPWCRKFLIVDKKAVAPMVPKDSPAARRPINAGPTPRWSRKRIP